MPLHSFKIIGKRHWHCKKGLTYYKRYSWRLRDNCQMYIIKSGVSVSWSSSPPKYCWYNYSRTSFYRHPLSTNTPAYNGKFRLSRRKAHICSLKLIHFKRTSVNTDNGHFPAVSRVTHSKVTSTRFPTLFIYLYLHNVYDWIFYQQKPNRNCKWPFKGSSNIQSTWLSRKLRGGVSTKSKITKEILWEFIRIYFTTFQFLRPDFL